MRISVTDAKGQLTELVRRAEAGDEIILTRHGQAAVCLVPIKSKMLEGIRMAGAARATPGPGAARSQDFLYGEDGLPKYLLNPLDDCFERVDRASEHLGDLERRIDGAIRKQANALVIEHDPNAPHHVKRVTRGSETFWEMRIAILIGEIFYNLRSALDYLIFKLAKLDSGIEQDGTQFPIDDEKESFDTHVKRGWLEGLNAAHCAAIEGLQPYNGCDWSKRLRDYSNPDKHRHLIATGGDGIFHVHSSLEKDLSRCWGYEHEAPHPVPGQPPVKVKVYFSGNIAFGNGAPIIDTIREIKAGVADTLAKFSPEFLAG